MVFLWIEMQNTRYHDEREKMTLANPKYIDWAKPFGYGAMPQLVVRPKRFFFFPHGSAACGGLAELIYFGDVAQLTLLQIESCRYNVYQ